MEINQLKGIKTFYFDEKIILMISAILNQKISLKQGKVINRTMKYFKRMLFYSELLYWQLYLD